MKKTSLTERFQELAGIKPLAEQPKMRNLRGAEPKFPSKAEIERMKQLYGSGFMDAGGRQAQGYLDDLEKDKEEKPVAADAEKLANSPILSQINSRVKWEDAMDVLMKKADDIDQVSDSVKRTWLQNALKAI